MRPYAPVQLINGVHVDNIDVTIAKITLRTKIDREIEEIEAVRDVPVDNSQKNFLGKAMCDTWSEKPPVGNVTNHQSGARVVMDIVDID